MRNGLIILLGAMKPRRLVQRNTTGCGLACVAMVTNKTYGEIRNLAIKLGIVKENGSHITSSAAIRRLVEASGGRAMQGRKATHWGKLPDLAVAGINYSEVKNEWHWVIFVRTALDMYVLDPWHKTKTKKRRDFGRMRLRSSIPIRAQQGTQRDGLAAR
jgi:hypothetical protein